MESRSSLNLGTRCALVFGAFIALSACAPTTYYLANVYRDSNNELYVQRCPAYASGKYGDSSQLSTKDCIVEKVGDLPPDLVPQRR